MVAPPKQNGLGKRKERRNSGAVQVTKPAFPDNVELEEDAQESEGGLDDGSDDGEVDEFPELDPRSDASDEEDEEEEEEEDTEDEEEDEENSEDSEESEIEDLHIFPEARIITSEITGQPKKVYPEIEPDYDSDSSTEDNPNRVGNIPMHWYDDLPHVGYDINGKKVLRPARGDELDKFLQTVEDPSAWTSALDKSSQQEKKLTSEELELIKRLYENENPDSAYDPYEPTVEWFTGKGKEEVMPLSGAPEPKRRWVSSKWEKQKVMKIVRAIREGRILPSKAKTASREPQFYALWATPSSDHPPPPAAPKVRLPTNAESYNPPEEYLPDEKESAEWEATEKEDRERDYLPHKYAALRLVPGYDQFIQERFSRQLDLYMAPRIQRKKLDIDPESLIPKLPSPSSLKPFPVYQALRFSCDKDKARCLSVSPDGAWVISGDDNGVVSLWEILVGREVKRWKFSGRIGALEWCPRLDVSFIAVGVEDHIHFIIPPNVEPSILSATRQLLAPTSLPPPPDTPSPVKWHSTSKDDSRILTLDLPTSSGLVKQIVWHRKGDYLASVSGMEQASVWIHQVARRHSQAPFRKVKGSAQLVKFHPTKPHFFVATQKHVRLYDLAAQKLIKALLTGMRWISSLDIHPSGDHLIVGGYDRKLCWFDLELSDKPYKILRYHSRAIRHLQFHPTLPLFASSSDDGTIQIFHARVFSDLMTDPLIVPLKILRGHDIKDNLGVLQFKWCNGQPWLVSAGADGDMVVWCS